MRRASRPRSENDVKSIAFCERAHPHVAADPEQTGGRDRERGSTFVTPRVAWAVGWELFWVLNRGINGGSPLSTWGSICEPRNPFTRLERRKTLGASAVTLSHIASHKSNGIQDWAIPLLEFPRLNHSSPAPTMWPQRSECWPGWTGAASRSFGIVSARVLSPHFPLLTRDSFGEGGDGRGRPVARASVFAPASNVDGTGGHRARKGPIPGRSGPVVVWALTCRVSYFRVARRYASGSCRSKFQSARLRSGSRSAEVSINSIRSVLLYPVRCF